MTSFRLKKQSDNWTFGQNKGKNLDNVNHLLAINLLIFIFKVIEKMTLKKSSGGNWNVTSCDQEEKPCDQLKTPEKAKKRARKSNTPKNIEKTPERVKYIL